MMITISATQRKNLLKLADYLLNLPEDYKHFDMFSFIRTREIDGSTHDNFCSLVRSVEQFLNEHTCNTVACAVGHGPSAGIKAKKNETWHDYRRRCFINDEHTGLAFDWLFGASWSWHDNTPEGAALRIYYFLDYGIPDDFCSPDDEITHLYYDEYDVVEA